MVCFNGTVCLYRYQYGISYPHKSGITVYDHLGLSFNNMNESSKR